MNKHTFLASITILGLLGGCIPGATPKNKELVQGSLKNNSSTISLASFKNCNINLPEAPIYIIAGQSNAGGLGKMNEELISMWQNNFKFKFWNSTTDSFNATAWLDGKSILSQNAPDVITFGPELLLSYNLQNKDNKSNFYIFKAAYGGTTLGQNSGDASRAWLGKGDKALYDKLIQDFNLAASKICQSGFNPVVKGFFWMQGESDATEQFYKNADNYRINLQKLIDNLSEDIPGAYSIVIAQIKETAWSYLNSPVITQQVQKVRLAQHSLAEYKGRVIVFDTSSLSAYSAPCSATNGAFCAIHLDSNGQVGLGNYFYQAFSTAPITDTGNIVGSIDEVQKTSSGHIIRGWACAKGISTSIRIHLYLNGGAGHGTMAGEYLANQQSENAVAQACEASGNYFRFSIPVDSQFLQTHHDKSIFIHGISPNGKPNEQLNNSGNFSVPKISSTPPPNPTPIDPTPGKYVDIQSVMASVGPVNGQTGSWWCSAHYGSSLGGNWECFDSKCKENVNKNDLIKCGRLSYSDIKFVSASIGPVKGQTGTWWCSAHFGRGLGGTWDCLSGEICNRDANTGEMIQCGRR